MSRQYFAGSFSILTGMTIVTLGGFNPGVYAQESRLTIVEAEDSVDDPDILRDLILGSGIQISPSDDTTAYGRILDETTTDLLNGVYNQFGTFTGGLRAGLGVESGITFSSGTARWASYDFDNLDPDEFGNYSEGGRAVDNVDIYTRGSDTTPWRLANDTILDQDLNDLIGVSGDYDPFTFEFDRLTTNPSDERRDTTMDAAGLEFTFTAGATGRLAIDYVFASDEYHEWDGDGNGDEDGAYDDVMGIFLKQSSVSTYANIAVQPDENETPITLFELNASKNPYLLQSNDRFSASEGALDDLPLTPGYEIGYDGFTTRMTAYADVTQGVEYDIKLVVADAYQLGFESAIFIPDDGMRIQTSTADPGVSASLPSQRGWVRYSVADGLEADDITVASTSTSNDSGITGDTLQNQAVTVQGEYTQASKRITTNHLTVANTAVDPAEYDLTGGVLFANFLEIGDHTYNTDGSAAGTFTYTGGKLIANRVVVDDGGEFVGHANWSHDRALDVINGGEISFVDGTTRYSLTIETDGRFNLFQSDADLGDVTIQSGAFVQVVAQDIGADAQFDHTKMSISGRFRQYGGAVNLITRLPRGSAGITIYGGDYTLDGGGVLEFQTTRPTLNTNYGRAMIVGHVNEGTFDLIDGTIRGTALTGKPDGPRISIGNYGEGTMYVRADGAIEDAEGIHVGMLYRTQSGDSRGELHVMGGSIETAILYMSSEFMIDDPEEPSIDRDLVSSLLNITDNTSVIEVADLLRFGANAEFTAVAGSTITITGDEAEVDYETTDDTLMEGTNNLSLKFLGNNTSSGFSTLEVAGYDEGDDVVGFVDNYSLAELIVGQTSSNTVVKLVDNFDNATGTEVLYVEDITIALGSTLDIGSIDIYALSINDVTRISGTGTVTIVPPGGGIPEPASVAMLALSGTALLRRSRAE